MVALGTIRSRASIEREALKALDGMRLGNGRVSPKRGSSRKIHVVLQKLQRPTVARPITVVILILDSSHGYSHDLQARWQEVEQRDMRNSQKDSASFMYANAHQ